MHHRLLALLSACLFLGQFRFPGFFETHIGVDKGSQIALTCGIWAFLTCGQNPFRLPTVSKTEAGVYCIDYFLKLVLIFTMSCEKNLGKEVELIVLAIPCVGCLVTAVSYVFKCWNPQFEPHNENDRLSSTTDLQSQGAIRKAIAKQLLHRFFVLVSASIYVIIYLSFADSEALKAKWGEPRVYLSEFTLGLLIAISLALEEPKVATITSLAEIASALLYFFLQFSKLWMALIHKDVPSYIHITSGVIVCVGLLTSMVKLDPEEPRGVPQLEVPQLEVPQLEDLEDPQVVVPDKSIIASSYVGLVNRISNWLSTDFSEFAQEWRLHRAISIISLLAHVAAAYYIGLKVELEEILGKESSTLIEFALAISIVLLLFLEKPEWRSFLGISASIACALHFNLTFSSVWFLAFEKECPQKMEVVSAVIVFLAIALGYFGFLFEEAEAVEIIEHNEIQQQVLIIENNEIQQQINDERNAITYHPPENSLSSVNQDAD